MYECDYCLEIFSDLDKFEDHLDDEDYWIECPTCRHIFRNQSDCNQHMNATNHWAECFKCETCTRVIVSKYAADRHMDEAKHWAQRFQCNNCNTVFHSQDACDQHMNDMGHWVNRCECETCTEVFFESACNQHMTDSNHWAQRFKCDTCTMVFLSQNACTQHMNETGHWAKRFKCDSCTAVFFSQNETNQHMTANGHWAKRFPCETCAGAFVSEQAVNQHMRAVWHYKNYCINCDLHFQNENDLRMHLNSTAHRGPTVICPFCKTNFTTASGLTNHLEAGACPSAPGLNRQTILRMVRERDPGGIITKKEIGWHENKVLSTVSTQRAFNGFYWECYICHDWFNAQRSVDQHLNSPVHKQSVYHCPNSKGTCGREFTTLGALFNHLESESCGFMRFENVQKKVKDVWQANKMVSF